MSDTFTDDAILDDDEDDETARAIENGNFKASNAWRSIERHREMKELRKHLDDFLYEDAADDALKELRW